MRRDREWDEYDLSAEEERYYKKTMARGHERKTSVSYFESLHRGAMDELVYLLDPLIESKGFIPSYNAYKDSLVRMQLHGLPGNINEFKSYLNDAIGNYTWYEAYVRRLKDKK